jgi:hypothetical protein
MDIVKDRMSETLNLKPDYEGKWQQLSFPKNLI